MDFTNYAVDGSVTHPFAGRTVEGDWLEGTTLVEYLNNQFMDCADLNDCIQKADDGWLRKMLQYLKDNESSV